MGSTKRGNGRTAYTYGPGKIRSSPDPNLSVGTSGPKSFFQVGYRSVIFRKQAEPLYEGWDGDSKRRGGHTVEEKKRVRKVERTAIGQDGKPHTLIRV